MEVAPRLFAWHDGPAWSPPPPSVCLLWSKHVRFRACLFVHIPPEYEYDPAAGQISHLETFRKALQHSASFSSTHRWIGVQYSVQIKSPCTSSTQLSTFKWHVGAVLSLWLSDVPTTYVLWHMTSWIIDWNDVQNKPKATLPLLQQTICCYFRSAFGYLADSHLYREHVWCGCCR